MKKKFLTLMVMGMMIFTFGCSQTTSERTERSHQEEDDDDYEDDEDEDDEDEDDEDDEDEVEDEDDDDEVVDDEEDDDEVVDDEDDESVTTGYKPSVINGSVYESEYLGIGCDLGKGWTFLSEEELLERNQLTREVLSSDETLVAALDKISTLLDMAATKDNATNGLNITITFEKPGISVSESLYAKTAANNAETAFNAMGVNFESADVSEIEFAGETHSCVDIKGNMSGVDIYEKMVVIKKDEWYVGIVFTALDDNDFDDLIDSFYAL